MFRIIFFMVLAVLATTPVVADEMKQMTDADPPGTVYYQGKKFTNRLACTESLKSTYAYSGKFSRGEKFKYLFAITACDYNVHLPLLVAVAYAESGIRHCKGKTVPCPPSEVFLSDQDSKTKKFLAEGMFQLHAGAAEDCDITNRKDLLQNIRGGACYIRKGQNKYPSDWRYAFAYFNGGPTILEKSAKVQGNALRYSIKVLKLVEEFHDLQPKKAVSCLTKNKNAKIVGMEKKPELRQLALRFSCREDLPFALAVSYWEIAGKPELGEFAIYLARFSNKLRQTTGSFRILNALATHREDVSWEFAEQVMQRYRELETSN